MQIIKMAFQDRPEKILEEKFDCIWIAFSPQSRRGPLQSPALQWLDWKLRGQISRFLWDSQEKSKPLTFVPTMNKLPAPYLALHAEGKVDWDLFVRNCEGLKLSRLLYFCEDESKMSDVERQIKDRKMACLDVVAIGS